MDKEKKKFWDTWKKIKVNLDDFDSIYDKYKNTNECDLCKKPITSYTKHLDHDHKTGNFRNVLCNVCNARRADIFYKSNTTGYRGISKDKCKTTKCGYRYRFCAVVNGKQKNIKSSINFEKLKEFAEKWKKDNNYLT